MKFTNIEKNKKYPIIIWGHPKGTHTHSWIHYRFFRAFRYLWFDVQWLENKKKNLPNKNKDYIIITETGQDRILLENFSNKWRVFDHNISHKRYSELKNKNIIPFWVIRYNLAKFTDKKIWQYITEWDTPIMDTEEYYFQLKNPRILRWSELLPHEISHTPYHYNNNKDVIFIGSRRHNNFIQLEQLRFRCIKNKKRFKQYGKHILLRQPFFNSSFVSPEDMEEISRSAYIAPALQGVQVDDGYIPCRLFINMSLSILAVSNNPYVYNLFDNDEVIVDRNIGKMMEKAERIIRDKKVDQYTKKALKKVKEEHTYINRIEELFSYL